MPVHPGIPSFSSSKKILDPDRTTDAVRTVSPIPKAMLAAPGHAHDRNEEARQGRRVSEANKYHEGRQRPEWRPQTGVHASAPLFEVLRIKN
jgi:hypothetical protein